MNKASLQPQKEWGEISTKSNLFYRVIKRVFEFLMALIMLSVLSPLLIIGMLISLCSTKYFPLFFDKRIGKNGKEIKVIKLRTMFKDSETNIEKYLNKEQIEQWELERKVDNDPRITRMGAFLRKTSIDELPQLLNIIAGSMSFVGPRPITKREMDANFTKEEQKVVTCVRPGLTGTWQVYGRLEETWSSGRRKQFDQIYLAKRSLLYDLKLFILTIPSCIYFMFHLNERR